MTYLHNSNTHTHTHTLYWSKRRTDCWPFIVFGEVMIDEGSAVVHVVDDCFLNQSWLWTRLCHCTRVTSGVWALNPHWVSDTCVEWSFFWFHHLHLSFSCFNRAKISAISWSVKAVSCQVKKTNSFEFSPQLSHIHLIQVQQGNRLSEAKLLNVTYCHS